MEVRFGPAGNADSFAAAGLRATVDAPRWLAEMGLNAYEYQCGHGVSVGQETATRIGQAAAAHGIALSLHTPYYINLSSREEERVEKNIGYILKSCAAAQAMGASRLVVHCGGVGKRSRDQAMENTRQNVRDLLDAVEQAGYSQRLCLETMGKQSVIGSAEEVFSLVALDERLLPCIDFGHLNARTGGGMNVEGAYAAVLDQMMQQIGEERARIFHSHFSHIEYGPKGEVRHLTFADMQYGPFFEPLAQELARRGWTPTVICESAGTQAEDALAMKRMYEQTIRETSDKESAL